jgi:hypothetical protein
MKLAECLSFFGVERAWLLPYVQWKQRWSVYFQSLLPGLYLRREIMCFVCFQSLEFCSLTKCWDFRFQNVLMGEHAIPSRAVWGSMPPPTPAFTTLAPPTIERIVRNYSEDVIYSRIPWQYLTNTRKCNPRNSKLQKATPPYMTLITNNKCLFTYPMESTRPIVLRSSQLPNVVSFSAMP